MGTRADDILAYVEFHPGHEVIDAVAATLRNPPLGGLHADDMPGLLAVARLVKAGRLVRRPSKIPLKIADRLFTPDAAKRYR